MSYLIVSALGSWSDAIPALPLSAVVSGLQNMPKGIVTCWTVLHTFSGCSSGKVHCLTDRFLNRYRVRRHDMAVNYAHRQMTQQKDVRFWYRY